MKVVLKEGQKIQDVDGNIYLVEKGDSITENELHYSDEHKLELINNDWKQLSDDTFEKIFKSNMLGGELNPTGKAIVYLSFESSGRWIDVSIGFSGADWDGRNYIGKSSTLVKDIEKEILNYLKDKKTRFK